MDGSELITIKAFQLKSIAFGLEPWTSAIAEIQGISHRTHSQLTVVDFPAQSDHAGGTP
jgi:hypothetical protein